MVTTLKIGFAGTTQSNFDGDKQGTFQKSVNALRLLASQMGFRLYVYGELLINGEDAAKARKAMQTENVDFLLLQTTTFAAGDIITTLAKADMKLGLWALPEMSRKDSIFVNSRNSFCGVNMYASIVANYLKEHQIKTKWFYGYGDDPWFIERLGVTVRALTAIKRMRQAKVALVGGIAPFFNDLYFDERLGEKLLGVEIMRGHEFSEIEARAKGYSAAEIAGSAEELGTGYCACDASPQNLEIHARYYKAYTDFCAEYGYSALAVGCWPQMGDQSGGLSCSVVGKLNQNGIPAACEGDLPGAVSMLFQQYVTQSVTTLMDLSDLDEADQSVLMWHCGPSSPCLGCSPALTYSYQPDGKGGVKKLGLIHDMVFKPQHVTFMRFTGEWDRMFLADGDIMDTQKESPSGSRGWVNNLRIARKNVTVRDFVNTILVKGFQHHYPMVAGDYTREMMEAAAWLCLQVMEPVAYEDYLQV